VNSRTDHHHTTTHHEGRNDMSTTQRTRTAQHYRNDIAADYRAINDYTEMLALATKLGMEYEMERLAKCVAEFQEQLEIDIERAAADGYGPEIME